MIALLSVSKKEQYPAGDSAFYFHKLYDNKTAIERQIDILCDCGVDEVIIFTDTFHDTLQNSNRCTDRLKSFEIKKMDGGFYELLQLDLSDYSKSQDDFLLLHGNLVYTHQQIQKLINCKRSAILTVPSKQDGLEPLKNLTEVEFSQESINMIQQKHWITNLINERDEKIYPALKIINEDALRAKQINGVFGTFNELLVLPCHEYDACYIRTKDDFDFLVKNSKYLKLQTLSAKTTNSEPHQLASLKNIDHALIICTKETESSDIYAHITGYISKHTTALQQASAILKQENCDTVISIGDNSIINIGKYIVFNNENSVKHIVVPISDDYNPYALSIVHTNNEIVNCHSIIPDYALLVGRKTECNKDFILSVFCSALDVYITKNQTSEALSYACSTVSFIKDKNLLFLSKEEQKNNKFDIRIIENDSACVTTLAGESIVFGIAEGLHQVIGIPKGYALLLSCKGVVEYLWDNVKKFCNRKEVSDAIEDMAILLDATSKELSDILSCIYFLADGEKLTKPDKACFTEILKYVTNEQAENTLVQNLNTDRILNTIFQYSEPIYQQAQSHLETVESQGYNINCIRKPASYAQFKTYQFQRRAFYARNIMKTTQIGMLEQLIKLCRENSLKYTLIGDALMGAVKHGGFLPVSKGIEVAMPTEDISKLITLKLPSGLYIDCIQNNPDCMFSEVRLYLSGSYLERAYNLNALSESKEIYIPIFPLISANGKGFFEKVAFTLGSGLSIVLEKKRGAQHRMVGFKGRLFFIALNHVSVKTVQKMRQALLRNKKESAAYYYCDHLDSYYDSLIAKSKCFPSKISAFEGLNVNIPKVDSFLYKDTHLDEALEAGVYSFLMPAAYLLKASPQAEIFRISQSDAMATIHPTLIRRIRLKMKNQTSKVNKWWRTKVKPRINTFIKTQASRVKGNIRGLGIFPSANSKLIKSYKNKYQGKRCFLIGNGPSLSAADLDKLDGEITFACNFIHKIYDQTDWRPTYHFLSDSNTVRKTSWDIVKSSDEDKTLFMIREFAYMHMFVKPKKSVLFPYISCGKYKIRGNMLAYHYISNATVMSMMIEAAFYMGFKEIYLLGVEGTTSSSAGGNFAKNYLSPTLRDWLNDRKKKTIKDYDVNVRRKEITDRQAMVYQMLEDYSNKHGIKIYNASRNTYVESFTRINFDDVIKTDERSNQNE